LQEKPCTAPSGGKAEPKSVPSQRRKLELRGFSKDVVETMLHSRRISTNTLYATYIAKWTKYCQDRQQDFVHTRIPIVLDFLQTLVAAGLSYSTVNTAKAAVSTVIILPKDINLGTAPDVISFLKGVYNLKPPKPRYSDIWDPDTVLTYFNSKEKPVFLTTELLTKKLAMLILLTTGQRPQTLTALRISRMIKKDTTVEFVLTNMDIKQGRLGYEPPRIILRSYPHNVKLCVFTHLGLYLKRTAGYRGKIDSLFLTHKKPFKTATINTVSRWLKETLKAAGIDTAKYGPGSSRAASTSKAARIGAPINVIMKTAGWTRESTFTKFYQKQITHKTGLNDFILDQQ
jgi:integrase